MTTSSRIAKLLAGVGALAAHGAVAMVLTLPEPIQREGGAGAAEVRLGNGFADMAVGTMQAQSPDMAQPARPTETLAAATQPTPAPRAVADPVQTAHPQRVAEPVAQPSPMRPAETPRQDAARPAPVAPVQQTPDTNNVTQATPVSPAADAPAFPARESATAVKPQAQAAVTPQPAQRPPEPERLTAEPEREKGAVTSSLRPRPRTPEVEQTARAAQPEPRKKPEKTPRQQASSGNSDRNMRAGDDAGSETAKATSRGTGGTAKAAGNAAISNYPGQVMRKLSRAGKPRVNARGQAVVSFTVASNGGLQTLGLARSSGSSALDQAALRLVRSAAPFPQPPSGARRNFSIGIKGR